MAVYNFERLNILLVEDNSYVRNILHDLLIQLRFGRVTTATDGTDAIEFLKTIKPGGLDIIISDYVMSPIDGLLLLRWVRASKESPNRFMPFIMLSGAADYEYVNASRDMGVTEFLAKPFSSLAVSKRLLEVIDYPRQFIVTQTYYGPERRRQDVGSPKTEERRRMNEKDVAVVYSADKVVKPKTPTDVWYFRLPNSLKDKVGGMGDGGPGELPTEILEQAEEQLERSALDFTEWALEYLGQLSKLCDKALARSGDRTSNFHEINLLAHELRGQGGTFGYPLISIFGKMLYECTMEGCRKHDNNVEIVKAHIDAMRAVIREKIAGDGGQVGQALLASLKEAIKKQTKFA
ncbi:MAG: response regulator [Rhodospirillales bacterium]